MNYILNSDGEPEACPDLMTWAKSFETQSRVVAKEQVGDMLVSTVFLGIDHSFSGEGLVPVLWETMIFGGDLDEHQERCSGSRADALKMHDRVVAKAKGHQ